MLQSSKRSWNLRITFYRTASAKSSKKWAAARGSSNRTQLRFPQWSTSRPWRWNIILLHSLLPNCNMAIQIESSIEVTQRLLKGIIHDWVASTETTRKKGRRRKHSYGASRTHVKLPLSKVEYFPRIATSTRRQQGQSPSRLPSLLRMSNISHLNTTRSSHPIKHT